MNYIKTYESYSGKDILDTISDILLDANDDGFDAVVKSASGHNRYILLIVKRIGVNGHQNFDYNDVKDVIERSLDYLKSNGVIPMELTNDRIIEIYVGVWLPLYANMYKKDQIRGARIIFTLS